MITLLWPLTLLVTQLVLGYDHSIDYTRCNEDTACFVRESCIVTVPPQTQDQIDTNKKKLVQYKEDTVGKNMTVGGCDVVIQMKLLNMVKLHVMMQVKLSGADKLNIDKGLKLIQGTDRFICKRDSITGDTTNFENFVALGRQITKDQHYLCSFIAEIPENTRINDIFQGVDEKPKLVFTKDSGSEEVQYPEKEDVMWKLNFYCDQMLITSSTIENPRDSSTLLVELDTTMKPPQCSNAFVIQKKSDRVFIDTKKISCETQGPRNWKWKYEKSAGVMEPIVGEFDLYCLELTCRKCDSGSAPAPLDCPKCSPPSFNPMEAADKCHELKCTDNKWTLTGVDIVKGEPECRKSADNKYAWFWKGAELTKAACLDKIDCGAKLADGYPFVPAACKTGGNSEECKVIGLGTEKIKCKDDYVLEVKRNDHDNGEKNVSFVECDEATGLYRIPDKHDFEFNEVLCLPPDRSHEDTPASASMLSKLETQVAIGIVALLIVGVIVFVIFWMRRRKKKAATAKAEQKQQTSARKSIKSNNKSSASTVSGLPGEPADGSEGKKKSSRNLSEKTEKKFKLEDHESWTNEVFQKIILPNFKTCEPESKRKWVRHRMGRFYAYSNTKKTPESGTFNQFWLLVKQCIDDKCEDGGVWRELFRIAFTMAYTAKEKNNFTDEFHLLVIKPFEGYMVEYLKKCDFYMRKDEPRAETEMRVICIEILLHTRHPDVTEKLRTLTFNEKLEVPLRMLTSACYTRERDDKKPGMVHIQFKRVMDTSVLDPHISEGWGTFVQHVFFGMGGYLITLKDVYQYMFFEGIYQFPQQKDENVKRTFSPSDWLYAYKGALLHENSAKIALEMFIKLNETCLLHIETLLKQKYEDAEEREKAREQYKMDMKEYTLALADLLVGEDEYNAFKSGLHFVTIFVGKEAAKVGEPLDEERVRERAINMGNMIRDRDFAKQSNESLKAIGAKTAA